MLRRIVLLLALLALAAGVQAEESDPLTWIPADFAGFVRLQVDTADTLTTLDLASFAASFLQPTRGEFPSIQALDAVVPLAPLDVEDASFDTDFADWLGDEVVIAYKQFGRNFTAGADEIVLILPTTDALQSASNLGRIIQQQDILAREDYQGQTLYIGDKATIAFTSQVVLIGPTELVKAMLDLAAGTGDRLVDDPAYRAVVAADEPDRVVSGYLRGDEALRGLSVLVDGDETALPILQDLNQALAVYNDHAGLESLVLGNALDGIGFGLEADTRRLDYLRLDLRLYDAESTAVAAAVDFDPAVLDLIPQSAMVVHSGPDLTTALYELMTVAPLANFAGEFLSAFPVEVSAAMSSGLVDTPNAADIELAVGGFLSTLNQIANFDFDHDLAQYFSGGYAVALLPRPNDPLPSLNLPYDLLLVAHVDDADAALAGTTRLAQLLLGVDAFDTTAVDGIAFSTLQPDPGKDPVLYFGVVDDRLVVATGHALEQALDARRGDNRLVSRDRWQAVSDRAIPQLYVDIPAVYGVFLPQQVGPQLRQIKQLGARSDYLGDGLFEVSVLVTLPSQLG